MTCIVATRPLWEYILVTLGFALATVGLAWFAKDMWIHATKWRHYALASLYLPMSAGAAWVTVMTTINTVHYAIVLSRGMARC